MNVLIMTSDINVLRDQSSSRADILKRASLASHALIIVLNSSSDRYNPDRISNSLLIAPTNSPFRLLAPLHAFRIARRQFFFQNALQADLVIGDDAALAGVTAWLIAWWFKKPFLAAMRINTLARGYASYSIGCWAESVVALFVVRRANALAITSEGIRASLAEYGTALSDCAALIPRYMDIQAFLDEPIRVDLAAKYPHFKVILLVIEPLEPEYDVGLAITALAQVVRVFPHVGLVIVGDGSQKRKLTSKARSLGILDHIAFENRTENLSSYLKTARILLVTAPFLEYADTIAYAAAASCAIVSTPVGAASDLIEDGVTGFVCEPGDHACFASHIVELIRKPEVGNSVRMNAHLNAQNMLGSGEAPYLDFWRGLWQHTIDNGAGAARGDTRYV